MLKHIVYAFLIYIWIVMKKDEKKQKEAGIRTIKQFERKVFSNNDEIFIHLSRFLRDIDHDRGCCLCHWLRQNQDDELWCGIELVDVEAGMGVTGQRQTKKGQSWTSQTGNLLL